MAERASLEVSGCVLVPGSWRANPHEVFSRLEYLLKTSPARPESRNVSAQSHVLFRQPELGHRPDVRQLTDGRVKGGPRTQWGLTPP